MVRRPAAMAGEHGFKSPPNQPERLADRPSLPGALTGVHREIERPPHPWNREVLGDSGHSVQHRWKEMRVLVRIEMRRLQPGIQNAADLRFELLINANLPQRDGPHQAGYGFRQTRRSDQHQMASDVQSRILTRQAHGIVERSPGGHQRGRSQNAFAMRLNDSKVDVASEAEIVGVDDKTLH